MQIHIIDSEFTYPTDQAFSTAMAMQSALKVRLQADGLDNLYVSMNRILTYSAVLDRLVQDVADLLYVLGSDNTTAHAHHTARDDLALIRQWIEHLELDHGQPRG